MAKTYAMICNNIVIDVLHNQEVEPKYPPHISGSPIFAVVCPEETTRGWKYNPETGEVYEPVVADSVDHEPTQADRIEAKADYLLMTKEA